MKPGISVASLCMLGLLGISYPLQAQHSGFAYAGGGMTIPTGDFKNFDMAKPGWTATGGIGVNLTKSVRVEAEGWYGSNKYNDGTGDRADLLAGLATVGYEFSPEAKGSPYVLGGGGLMNRKEVFATGTSASVTKPALTGGVGYVYELSKGTHLWVEGRYAHMLTTSGATIIPITAGLSFNFGKR